MNDKDLIKLSMERWRVIDAFQKHEASQETIEIRWNQLNALRQTAYDLGINLKDDDSISLVRERWVRLKIEHGA